MLTDNGEKTRELLATGEYTCVLYSEKGSVASSERGVLPLIKWLESGEDFSGASAADKIVGRAAAFCYVLMGVKEVYAHVMSEGAAAILSQNAIPFEYESLVQSIMNRAGTGICPMEETVLEIAEPAMALPALKERLRSLGICV